MILENPPEVTAQTVFGKYVESSGLVFTGELIQMMIDRTIQRVVGNYWVADGAIEEAKAYHEHAEWWGPRYNTGIDLGRMTDFTVISTLDCLQMPARLVYYKRLNRVPWEAIYAEIGRVRQHFGTNILCDSTGPGGDVVMDALESRVYCPEHHRALELGQHCMRKGEFLPCNPNNYLALSCCEGYAFQTTTKRQLLDHLRVVLSAKYDARNPDAIFGYLRTPPIVQLEEEMTFYSWDDKKLQTDTLFSLALAAWLGIEEAVGDPSIGSPFGV